jgi:hypothetical protein
MGLRRCERGPSRHWVQRRPGAFESPWRHAPTGIAGLVAETREGRKPETRGGPRVARRGGQFAASADRSRGPLCTSLNHPESTYKSGKSVPTTGATFNDVLRRYVSPGTNLQALVESTLDRFIN